jgi:hypothetical protein
MLDRAPELRDAPSHDMEEHVATYELFLLIVTVAVSHGTSALLALAVGGVLGYWIAAGFIILIATIAALYSLATRSVRASIGALILSFLIFAAFGIGGGG